MLAIIFRSHNWYLVQEDRDRVDKLVPLLKEIFGYTDIEIDGFKQNLFRPPLAINFTLEQAKLAFQPIYDNNMCEWVYLREYNDLNKLIHSHIEDKLNITPQKPKSHYYDKPVFTREQLVNPYCPPPIDSDWICKWKYNPEIHKYPIYQERNINAYIPQSSTPIIPTHQVTCPYCHSISCSKITTTSKVVRTALFGVFSLSKNMKEWHCNSCGSNF